jgi:predicted RNase H-like HicB family nuclease
MAAPRIDFELRLPVRLRRDDVGSVIAHCELLDVIAEGETRDQAMSRLSDALMLFIETCFVSGTLETVLREAGFKKGEGDDDGDDGEDGLEAITVPLSLVASRGREALRR